MCGIAGYTGRQIDGLLDRMVAAIAARGPDGQGRFEDQWAHFGHTRLAIIDVAHGHQPMIRGGGRLVVTYNGEIYNYVELRADLQAAGQRFETQSDTEVLPLGYATGGESWFAKLNGMFAFALYDATAGEVLLARDHFGIKPLYYAIVDGELVFSSSARAVALHPGVDRRIDPDVVREFLQYRYAPSGRPFFRGVKSFPPGCIGRFREGRLTIRPYWQPQRRSPGNHRDEAAWVEALGEVLSDSLRIQLRSDVPVGVFLSGGLDSSLVTHYAAGHTREPLSAYTFAMGDANDELEAASAVAQRYRLRHLPVSAGQRLDFGRFHQAVACMDLPVGDAIILPTYLLCEAAAREHKVVLTGEGADEIFGGYVHYAPLAKLSRLARLAPWARFAAPIVDLVPLRLLDRFFDYQASLGQLGRHKLARMIGQLTNSGALLRQASTVLDDEDIVQATDLGAPPPPAPADLSLAGLIEDGLRTWLPHQILNKMDQLSMAHGLEARVPYLDPRVYDLLLQVPDTLIVSDKGNKLLLRKLLAKEGGVGAGRRKLAFHVPMEQLYRKDLTDLAQTWLSDDRIRRHGIIRPQFVADSLQQLEQGEFLASKRLVTMVSLHMWLEANESPT